MATISFAILKDQTILLPDEKSDSESQHLCQITAHDECFMSASLTFYGGFLVREFLDECY